MSLVVVVPLVDVLVVVEVPFFFGRLLEASTDLIQELLTHPARGRLPLPLPPIPEALSKCGRSRSQVAG